MSLTGRLVQREALPGRDVDAPRFGVDGEQVDGAFRTIGIKVVAEMPCN